jgi:hypothetical protein
LFLIPHAADRLQPLDLLTFDIMMQTFSVSEFNCLVNHWANKVARMLGASFAASAPHQNVEAFMSMGLMPVEGDGRSFLTVGRG